MAAVETLTVELRSVHGKRRNRRMRESGVIPAVLYGHKEASVSLAIPADQVRAVLRHGTRFVSLKGAVTEKALIKECQWDTWGNEVLHLDLTRVSEHEKIHMTVTVELRGEAPGTHEGGTVKHFLHEVEIECEASAIPEKLEVSINHLGLNKVLHVSDLVLPSGVKVLADPATIVVSCATIAETDEEASSVEGSNEPEVIGRKKVEEEE